MMETIHETDEQVEGITVNTKEETESTYTVEEPSDKFMNVVTTLDQESAVRYASLPSSSVYRELQQVCRQVEDKENGLRPFATFVAKRTAFRSNLEGLYRAVETHPNHDVSGNFATRLFQHIAFHAMKAPQLFPYGLPLIEYPICVDLSGAQIACILCNQFCCMLDSPLESEFPRNRYDVLLNNPAEGLKAALQCSLQYFAKIFLSAEPPRHWNEAKVRIRRCVTLNADRTSQCKQDFSVREYPKLSASKMPLCDFRIHLQASLEDNINSAHVDFANKSLGGGVLSGGCVQEEIYFARHPELIACKPICRWMKDYEALSITGVTQFAQTCGYKHSLCYIGPCLIEKPTVVAIDALSLKRLPREEELAPQRVDREIRKAFTGFGSPECLHYSTVSTGHWGCGAFRGTPLFKALLQWLAASQLSLNISYCALEEWKDGKILQQFVDELRDKEITVGQLYSLLQAAIEHQDRSNPDFKSLLRYIQDNVSSKECSGGLFKGCLGC
eukprot:gb/GECG01002720.1/.p1 GENE.gb/GECG01002720.1/~~gb/GECG01002720.1/.p1  ORF type:complete len:501 (+),score=47.54 gb/GECG01002720.1/:1-1503(+)